MDRDSLLQSDVVTQSELANQSWTIYVPTLINHVHNTMSGHKLSTLDDGSSRRMHCVAIQLLICTHAVVKQLLHVIVSEFNQTHL